MYIHICIFSCIQVCVRVRVCMCVCVFRRARQLEVRASKNKRDLEMASMSERVDANSATSDLEVA